MNPFLSACRKTACNFWLLENYVDVLILFCLEPELVIMIHRATRSLRLPSLPVSSRHSPGNCGEVMHDLLPGREGGRQAGKRRPLCATERERTIVPLMSSLIKGDYLPPLLPLCLHAWGRPSEGTAEETK